MTKKTISPMQTLYAKLQSLGFQQKKIKQLLPEWWNDDIAKTPAGTLTTGSNPRLSKAIQKTMDFVKQNGVEGDPVAFTEVVNEFAKIAGGYNNYVKAKYILETAKIADQRGLIVKEGVGNLEALHAIFGIPFKSVESNFTAIEKMTRDSKNRKKDIEDAVDRTLYLMH